MKSVFKLALAGLALCSLSHVASAQADVVKYFGVTGVFVDPDDARGTDRSGGGLDLLFGRQLKGPLYGEIRAFAAGFRGGTGTAATLYNGGLSADLHYLVGQRGAFSAFALAGVGFAFNDTNVAGGDEGAAQVNAGLGILSRSLTSSNIRLRLEGRAIREDYLGGVTDFRLGLGMEIPLSPAEVVVREVVVERFVEVGPPPGGFQPRPVAVDSDGDGVLDEFDACPDTPRGTPVDRRGCPVMDTSDRALLEQALSQPSVVLEGVKFDLGSDRLTPGSHAALNRVARIIAGHPGMTVLIAGHTDSTGPDELNKRLSLARAESVKRYLVSQGLAPSRMDTAGFGPSQPATSNQTAEGRAANRRVEFSIVSNPVLRR